MGKWIIIGLTVLFLVAVGIILLKFRSAVNTKDGKVKKTAPLLVLSVCVFAVIVIILTICLLVFVVGR